MVQVQDIPEGKVTRSPVLNTTGSPVAGVTTTSPFRREQISFAMGIQRLLVPKSAN
jgi:hypothetical protein